MALINQDQIVLVDRGPVPGLSLEHTLHESLDGADMDFRIAVYVLVLEPSEPEDFGEGLGTDHACRLEGILRLFAKGTAVDDEADPQEALGLKEAIYHGDGQLGLASAGGHRDEHFPLTFGNTVLDSLDRLLLVGAQVEAEIEGLVLELLLRGAAIDLKPFDEPLGREPSFQGPGCIRCVARIPEPDPALRRHRRIETPPIGGEDEGGLVATPRSTCEVETLLRLDILRIPRCLDVYRGHHVLAFSLRLDESDQCPASE